MQTRVCGTSQILRGGIFQNARDPNYTYWKGVRKIPLTAKILWSSKIVKLHLNVYKITFPAVYNIYRFVKRNIHYIDENNNVSLFDTQHFPIGDSMSVNQLVNCVVYF